MLLNIYNAQDSLGIIRPQMSTVPRLRNTDQMEYVFWGRRKFQKIIPYSIPKELLFLFKIFILSVTEQNKVPINCINGYILYSKNIFIKSREVGEGKKKKITTPSLFHPVITRETWFYLHIHLKTFRPLLFLPKYTVSPNKTKASC